jgi:membrane associated rhomboid family serine protease
MDTPRLSFRLPVFTAVFMAVVLVQYILDLPWGVSGSMQGLERVLHSVSSVLSHNDAHHILMNSAGIVAAVTSVEVLLGRRVWLVIFLYACVDAWAFTGTYVILRGASAFVMAALGVLVALLPAAVAEVRRGRGDLQTRLVVFAASLGVISVPLAGFEDFRGIGSRDGVAQEAHLRGLAFGVAVAIVMIVARVVRTRRARTDLLAAR